MRTTHRLRILFIIVLFAVLWLLTSCKTKTVYVPVETVRTEYKDRYLRDSIYLKELVRIYQRGDTVFRDSIVHRYKDKIKNDSIFMRDTIRIPIPVKGDTVEVNRLKWYQEACIWFTSLVLAFLGIRYRSVVFSFIRKFILKI
jgi:hypothetical protein